MIYDTIIAIDPDVTKSGVAFLRPKTRELEASSLTFPQLLDYLQAARVKSDTNGETLIVLVEAGWLHHSNWHLRSTDSRRLASAKGNATGRNHETGHKIVEMCRHWGLTTEECPPLRKCWRGADGKITDDELKCFTDLHVRTNQDMRDAVLLAWSFAGLPIRVSQ